jgi:hypothetical protein
LEHRVKLAVIVGLGLIVWTSRAAAGGNLVVRDVGVAVGWILANVAYATLPAENRSNAALRIATFILGFPGTLLTNVIKHDETGAYDRTRRT